MSLPLAQIRVLDLAQVLAGPFGAAMLGDLGADVIKVEPLRGDESRHLGVGAGLDSAMFIGANRNKRGIALDLTSEGGQSILHKLVATADIVVDNLRPDAKKKLGIDYPSLAAIKTDVIAINVSAFGTSGPYAGRPGIDPLAQALGGMMAITGRSGEPPLKTGSPVVDATTAHLVVIAALAALRRRDASGEGELIEVSLLDGLFNLQPTIMSQYFVSGHEQRPTDCGSELMAPYGCYQASDGRYWQVTALNQKFWVNICKALQCEDLLEDDRFASNADRMANEEALDLLIADAVSNFDSETLAQRFAEHDVLAAPVNGIAEATQDPQLLHNGMVTETEHAALGTIKTGTLPIKFSEAAPTTAAPTLGQHGIEILTELGLDTAEIEQLRSSNALG
jgi:crotonobetainyl-CoA:carnitine CoA-transferase CaiB-like acyl-CoA transferase